VIGRLHEALSIRKEAVQLADGCQQRARAADAKFAHAKKAYGLLESSCLEPGTVSLSSAHITSANYQFSVYKRLIEDVKKVFTAIQRKTDSNSNSNSNSNNPSSASDTGEGPSASGSVSASASNKTDNDTTTTSNEALSPRGFSIEEEAYSIAAVEGQPGVSEDLLRLALACCRAIDQAGATYAVVACRMEDMHKVVQRVCVYYYTLYYYYCCCSCYCCCYYYYYYYYYYCCYYYYNSNANIPTASPYLLPYLLPLLPYLPCND
jgi:hypothetical protein